MEFPMGHSWPRRGGAARTFRNQVWSNTGRKRDSQMGLWMHTKISILPIPKTSRCTQEKKMQGKSMYYGVIQFFCSDNGVLIHRWNSPARSFEEFVHFSASGLNQHRKGKEVSTAAPRHPPPPPSSSSSSSEAAFHCP